MTTRALALIALVWILIASDAFAVQSAEAQETFEYRLLATSKTSTMEQELNEASEAGFRLETVMGARLRLAAMRLWSSCLADQVRTTPDGINTNCWLPKEPRPWKERFRKLVMPDMSTLDRQYSVPCSVETK